MRARARSCVSRGCWSIQTRTRSRTPQPPRGWSLLRWYPASAIYLVASVAQGEFVFTPRVGSPYGEALLWVLLLVILFKWEMIRETDRFTIVTWSSVLFSFRALPSP